MCVSRHIHGDASPLDRPISAIAFPRWTIRSGVNQVGMLRYLHRKAGAVTPTNSSLTAPAESVGRCHQIAILRHLDGNVRLLDCSISAITLPSRPGRQIRQKSIGEDQNGRTKLAGLSKASVSNPPITGTAQIGVLRHRDGHADLIDFLESAQARPAAAE